MNSPIHLILYTKFSVHFFNNITLYVSEYYNMHKCHEFIQSKGFIFRFAYKKASEHKGVNPVLNMIGVNSLRRRDLHTYIYLFQHINHSSKWLIAINVLSHIISKKFMNYSFKLIQFLVINKFHR